MSPGSTRPASRASLTAIGIEAAAVLPSSPMFMNTLSASMPRRRVADSMILALAWWGTTRSTSSTVRPARSSTRAADAEMFCTAILKTAWPSKWSR